MDKLLLHACCAPCSNSALKSLGNSYNISLYWHNPNIYDFCEYSNRKNSAEKFALECGFEFLQENDFVYDYKKWKSITDEVCENCYRLRLRKTALYAKQNAYSYFSTSLLSSPYQKHDLIKQICQELADDMGLSFVYKDFRKFFYEGKNDLRSRGFYIQKYCACNKSFEARFGKRLDEN